jgi:S-adenosylmethionine synthetase
MNISLFATLPSPEMQPIEVVERKGIGHPDTLADGLAEFISNTYSKYCLEQFGAVLHHNFDKIMVSGGLFEAGFNKADMKTPATIIINGRASGSFGGKAFEITRMTEEAGRAYIDKTLPHADAANDFKFLHLTSEFSHNPHWFHPRSLNDIPDHTKPHANDSSTFSSYWPLSRLEQTVLAIEGLFYRGNAAPRFEFLGQDIKVLAVRRSNKVSFVVCIPQIAQLTSSRELYIERKEHLQGLVTELVGNMLNDHEASVSINTADGNTGEKHYLLATGSCIEAGEEGVVGRGNKSRGIISSTRSASMEAIAGKNPVYHVGKVLAAICDSLSKTIAQRFNCSCEVHISTKNGDPLYEPEAIVINASKSLNMDDVQSIVRAHLEYKKWTSDIINGLFVPKPGRGNDYSIEI